MRLVSCSRLASVIAFVVLAAACAEATTSPPIVAQAPTLSPSPALTTLPPVPSPTWSHKRSQKASSHPTRSSHPSPKPTHTASSPTVDLPAVQSATSVVCGAANKATKIFNITTADMNAVDLDALQADAILLAYPAGRFVFASKLYSGAHASDPARHAKSAGTALKSASDQLIRFTQGDDSADPTPYIDSFTSELPLLLASLRKYGITTCR
jgi:hypothetical protein